MSTNVAKKSEQKPKVLEDKIQLTGITPIEVQDKNGKYIITTVPEKEFCFSSVKATEEYIEINAYDGSKPKEANKGTGRGE